MEGARWSFLTHIHNFRYCFCTCINQKRAWLFCADPQIGPVGQVEPEEEAQGSSLRKALLLFSKGGKSWGRWREWPAKHQQVVRKEFYLRKGACFVGLESFLETIFTKILRRKIPKNRWWLYLVCDNYITIKQLIVWQLLPISQKPCWLRSQPQEADLCQNSPTGSTCRVLTACILAPYSETMVFCQGAEAPKLEGHLHASSTSMRYYSAYKWAESSALFPPPSFQLILTQFQINIFQEIA